MKMGDRRWEIGNGEAPLPDLRPLTSDVRLLTSWTKTRESGFTLPELLVVLSISGILFSSLTATFLSQARVYRVWQDVSQMQQTVRASVDLITRELHMAGYDPLEKGLTGLAYDSGQLRIVADLNRDGDAGDTHEDITYRYDAATRRITRSTGGGAQPFAENIEAFSFVYLDEHGAPTSTTAAIRAVKINVVGRTPSSDPDYPKNAGYRTYSLTSTVTPANLAL